MATDAAGAPLRGSLKKLIRAVRSGADIKIATDQGTEFRPCSRVSLVQVAGETHVACNNMDTVALTSSSDPLTLRPIPIQAINYFDTAGQQGVARVSVYGGADLGQSTSTVLEITWFARVR